MRFKITPLLLSLTILTPHSGCSAPNEPDATTAHGDETARYDVGPGPKGEPPPELLHFEEPAELVWAGAYFDGGTIWASLRDQEGYVLLFCVTPDDEEFATPEVPPGSLMLGGTNSREPSARFPLSKAEARRVINILQRTLSSIDQDFRKKPFKKWTDEEQRTSLANGALQRLESTKSFKLADRKELAERTAKLVAVDFEATAGEFRSLEGKSRIAVWDRLQPSFLGAFRQKKITTKQEMAEEIKRYLGEPNPKAVTDNLSMISSPFADPTPIHDDVLGYILSAPNDKSTLTLIIDFRHSSVPAIMVLGWGG